MTIRNEVKQDSAYEINLTKTPITPGKKFQFGATTVTLVCGFSKPPADWGIHGESELNNAGSIVVRVEYKRKSILLCGDAVGRHIDDHRMRASVAKSSWWTMLLLSPLPRTCSLRRIMAQITGVPLALFRLSSEARYFLG